MATRALFVAMLGALLAGATPAQAQTKTFALDSLSGVKPHKVNAEAVTYGGKKVIRVTEPARAPGGSEDRLVFLEGVEFQDGVIEAEIAGAPGAGAVEGARGFVGIAFRAAADGSKFECIYLRPTNGRAEDQVRRNHSVQYISHPEFPWQRLRKEFPEKYETYVDLAPGEWTQVRVEAKGAKARLYVHGNPQPALLVDDLKMGAAKGAVALWIGPGTVAHFANVRISR